MLNAPPAVRRLLVLLVLAAGATGCDEAVEPTLETDRVFTLYGTLDPTASRQAIRIVPITDRIDAPTDTPLGATITSVESGTGQTVVWRDSLVTFPNGEQGYVALADGYTPRPGSTVTLTARAADGREARASATVPALAQPAVAGAGNTVAVSVPGVPAANLASAGLVVRVAGLPGATADTVALALPQTFRRTAGGYTIAFAEQVQTALRSANGIGQARLVDVTVRTFVTGAGWSIPEGGYDPDVIVEPGVLTNVEGGFGFVGGGYVAETRWTPSLPAQAAAGFAVSQDPASVLRINEVFNGPSGAWIELYNPTNDGVQLNSYRLVSTRPGASVFDLPSFIRVEAGQFAVFDVPFTLEPGEGVALQTTAGASVVEFTMTPTVSGGSVGRFLDGRSLAVPVRGGRPDDRFVVPLTPTRGARNRPARVPVVVNEIYTAGLDGFVEVVAVDPARFEIVRVGVASGPEGSAEFGVEAELTGEGSGRYVAEEVRNSDPAAALRLNQIGGEVLVFVTATDLETGLTSTFLSDVRSYGPQDLDRSVGYLPDGPGGAWSTGLSPTRGLPNASGGRVAGR